MNQAANSSDIRRLAIVVFQISRRIRLSRIGEHLWKFFKWRTRPAKPRSQGLPRSATTVSHLSMSLLPVDAVSSSKTEPRLAFNLRLALSCYRDQWMQLRLAACRSRKWRCN